MNIKEFALKYHGIVLQRHQMKWIKFLEESGTRCILLAPRGHGKTTTINQVWLSWVIANHPDVRALLISHSKEMAESFSRTIRNIMENPELQEEFNFNLGSPWRANSWRLQESPHSKPTLETKGAMGRMAGWRGDMVVFDDLLDTNTVATESIMAKITNWIKTDVLPAINPSELQKVVVVGTRKHIDDWYGELLQNPTYEQRLDRAWDVNKRPLWPNIIDEHGNTIAPRYTREYLEAIREEIGPLLFAQEYLNEPSPPEGLQLKYDWLRFYEHLPEHGHLDYYAGVDPSAGASKDKRTSWLAIAIIAYDRIYNEIYVCDLYRGKHSPEEQVRICTNYFDKYPVLEKIYVEAVFEYTYVYKALKDRYVNVRDKDYIHTKLKGVSAISKEERIKEVLAPYIELGKIKFRHPSTDQYMKTFVHHEYLAFPFGDFDMLDALTLATHRLVKLGRRTMKMPFYFPKT